MTPPKKTGIDKRNIIFVIGLLAACGLLLWVITSSMAQAVYSVTVDEALMNAQQFEGREIKVKGNVVPGSILCEPGSNRCKFRLTKAGASLDVFYSGERPDTFKDCSEVVATGRLKADGPSFEAASLIAKCPSKYDDLPGGCEKPTEYGKEEHTNPAQPSTQYPAKTTP
jgi:cytochrome c-type biogenesis protein CcmE